MASDLWGNAISGEDPAVLAAIDAFAGGFVSYQAHAVSIVEAARIFSDHPLVQAWSGMLHLLAEQKGAEASALPYLRRAEAALPSANLREQRIVSALATWIAGDIDGTITAFEAVLADFPRDLTTLKLLHYHLFNRGDFPGLLRSALISVRAASEIGYVHGMAAFGYEQLHLLEKAEQSARRALHLLPSDPWAQHALAHVMLTQGRIGEGIDFLEPVSGGWIGLNSFMVTHLWWHLALFYLSAGRDTEALAAYDRQVWAVAKDYSQDQIGAVSLLSQLELAGVDPEERWQDLADYLVTRAEDVVQPFLSVQYLYGLARAGRPEADRLLGEIKAAACDNARQDSPTWREAALPLAHGLVAHARGYYDEAADRIGEALPRLLQLGGSHAQRDLFDQFLLNARIRAGRLVEVQQTLELRRMHDPEGVPLNRQLAFVYQRLGLDDLAGEASSRVTRRLAR